MQWAKNEEELKNRIIRIKALQLNTAEKIDAQTKEKFIQRIDKRRQNRESELITNSTQERKQLLTLAYVLETLVPPWILKRSISLRPKPTSS